MNRTKIEWARNPDGSPGYTLNPASGCENHTPEGLCLGGLFPCYAWKLAHGRLKPLYLEQRKIGNRIDGSEWPWAEQPTEEYLTAFNDPFYPRFWEERLADVRYKKGRHLFPPRQRRGIFVCDMGDLFGIGVPEEWTRRVMQTIRANPQDRFYLLTKQPGQLIKWSPFPDNCYVGVTATDGWDMPSKALGYLWGIQAKVKYISFEPLLGGNQVTNLADNFIKSGINWLIIGACTGSWEAMANLCMKHPGLELFQWGKKWTAQPKIEWVREIVAAADKARIKVFLKDNLRPILNYPITNPWAFQANRYDIRQEMPG